MCGIMGIFSFQKFGNKPIKEKVVKLMLDIEERGTDATGISLINTEKNLIKVIKTNIRATKFKRILEKLDYSNYNLILGHTRLKTQGTETKNKNNHPFYDKKFNNCLIHNGQVLNYTELKNHFKLKLVGECDSEVILSLFNNRRSIEKTIKHLDGSFAFGLYSNRKLFLYKNSNPLYSCYNEDEDLFLFSSNQSILTKVFGIEKIKKYGLFIKGCGLYYKSFEDCDLMTIDFKKENIFLKQIDINQNKTDSYMIYTTDKKTEKQYFIFDEEDFIKNQTQKERRQQIRDTLKRDFDITEWELNAMGYTLDDAEYLTFADLSAIYDLKGGYLQDDLSKWRS